MRWRWWYWLLIPFWIPNVIVSLLQLPFYRPTSWRWRAGCWEIVAGRTTNRRGKDVTRIWGRPGAQSVGSPFLYFATERQRDLRDLSVHERVHAIHGILVNALATAIIWPLLFTVLGELPWWAWYPLAVAGPAGFGLAYGAHFAYEWAKIKFGPWRTAYLLIWSERIAYRNQREYVDGKRPWAWGG